MAKERSISKLAALLKAKYREYAAIARLFYPDHPLPIEQCYLHLAFVEEKTFNAQKDKDNQEILKKETRDYFLHNYERIQHNERKLMPEQLLAECRHTPKRIYIEGAAGAGKTTLSQFIAYQWANDHPAWKYYDFLFRIRLRDLTTSNYPENKINFFDFLEKECFRFGFSESLTENEKSKLDLYLRSKNKKVLLILDGYDELTLESKAVKILWKSIIDSTYDFILTSRPGIQKIDLKVNLNVVVLGFSDEQVKKYIQYFYDPQHTPDAKSEDANLCLQTFHQNLNLWSLAHIPIQLELLCSIWGEKIKQIPDSTLTSIYTLMLEQLLIRHEQKRLKSEEGKDVISKDIDVNLLLDSTDIYLQFLEYAAFLGMERNELLLSYLTIEAAYNTLRIKSESKLDFVNKLKDIGFIMRNSDGKKMEFIHLTFQEYFAARYIMRCFKLQQVPILYSTFKEFIAKQKYNPRYEIIWWMVAGLLSKNYEQLRMLFCFLRDEPRDYIGLNLQLLQLRCFEESQYLLSGDLEKSIETSIIMELKRWINYEMIFSEKFKLHFIADYLAICPNIFQMKTIQALIKENLDNLSKINNTLYLLRKQTALSIPILNKLADLLGSPVLEIRFSVTDILASQRELPKEILDKLLNDLSNNSNLAIKYCVANILAKQHHLAENIINEIFRLLKNSSPEISHYAVTALAGQKILSEDRISELILSLTKADSLTRYSAIRLVLDQKLPCEALQQLIALLKDKNPNIQIPIIRALMAQEILPDKIIKQLMIIMLKDLKWDVRYSAASTLAYQKGLSSNIVQQLVKLLKSSDPDIKTLASRALGSQNNLTVKIQKRLVKLLSGSPNWILKFSAAATLAWQERIDDAILSELGVFLKNSDWEVRASAARALAGQDSLPLGILTQLYELLKDSHLAVRYFVTKVLAKGRELNDLAIICLVKLLGDSDQKVKFYAANALAMQNELGINIQSQLLMLIKNSNKDTGEAAAKVLQGQRRLSNDIILEIRQLLKDENGNIRLFAARILSKQAIFDISNIKALGKYINSVDKIAVVIDELHIDNLISSIKINSNLRHLDYYLRLLFLKCQSKKIALYFVDNELFLDRKYQDVFLAVKRHQFVNRIYRIFYDITGMIPKPSASDYRSFQNYLINQMLNQVHTLFQWVRGWTSIDEFNKQAYLSIMINVFSYSLAARFLNKDQQERIIRYALERRLFTFKNNKESFFQYFGISTQLPGDNPMEEKNPTNTIEIEKAALPRERIVLDIRGIEQAIKEQISDKGLQQILTDLLKEAQVKQEKFNQASLKNNTFCQLRDGFISRLKNKIKEIDKSEHYADDDKQIALGQILPDILFPFWRCRPYQKTETSRENEQNQQKEQQLFNEQQQLRSQPAFLEALNKISAERAAKITNSPKVYFMYAWPVEAYQSRESWVQPFLQVLHDDLMAAGIEVVFDKEDNFSGNNLYEFMGQILHDNGYVMIFGTESFRHKWFGEKTALQFEGKLLQLKWLTDLGENKIVANQKTTIIPWVLTGIRETSIPEDLLLAKNPTVRALYTMGYCKVLTTILSGVYGINEKGLANYFTDIKLEVAHSIVQQAPTQVNNKPDQQQNKTPLDTPTLEGIRYEYKYHPEYKRYDIEFEIDDGCDQRIFNFIENLYQQSKNSSFQLDSIENINQRQFIETVLDHKPASNTNRPISSELKIHEAKFSIKIKSKKNSTQSVQPEKSHLDTQGLFKNVHNQTNVSMPAKLAQDKFAQDVKDKIKNGLSVNPYYKLLLEMLVQPEYKDEKEFIKEEMRKIREGTQDPNAKAFLEWVDKNKDKVEKTLLNVHFENNFTDLFIRDEGDIVPSEMTTEPKSILKQ